MSSPALSLDGIQKTFSVGFLGALPVVGRVLGGLNISGIARSVHAVKSITLDVQPGEIFGFLGPNGAGKTTTIKMICGLIRPSGGQGELLGHPLGHRMARARLGYMPEHPYFYDHLKPLELLSYYGRLFKMTSREAKQRAEELVDRVGLRYAADRPLRKFSKGMIQRIGIAQALINDPDLVVLDEPMSGLDPMGRKEVRDIIFELKERGKTVFFSSHVLQDVEMICDRVAIVVQGKLRSMGSLSQMLEAPTHDVEITVEALEPAQVEQLAAHASSYRVVGSKWLFRLQDPPSAEAFARRVLDGPGRLVSLVPVRQSLESVFVAEATRRSAS